jgi:hypothetical protein
MRELSNKQLQLIKEDPSIINWNKLCKEYIIPYRIIKKNLNRISLRVLFKYQQLPETFIEQYLFRKDLIPIICANQELSVRFMFKYRNILDWNELIFSQRIPEGLLRRAEVIDKINIDDAIIAQSVSEKFINDFKDRIDWNYIKSICKTANF